MGYTPLVLCSVAMSQEIYDICKNAAKISDKTGTECEMPVCRY